MSELLMKYDFEEKVKAKKPLTEKQGKILNFIKKYIAEYNYAPTIREIGEGNNLSSSATVHTYINILIEKGFLKKSDYKFRTLEVVGENEYVNQAKGISLLPVIYDDDSYSKQINEPKEKLEISQEQFNINNQSIIIHVTKDDIFKNGDNLIIKKITKYNDNDYVVTLNNDRINIVKYANNKDIIGKVIALIRKY